ncbi:MAG TPA: nitrilase-related carbon-nitrogen hydrolase, partial [Candidatus Micrarchaeota archaeon]|nr:nitrilase-related carbon-nitrogen hydrolase [Candidatus Micrarchaeota archaeon]
MQSSLVKIGIVQMSMSSDIAKNLEKATSMAGEAASKGAHIVCLPELFTTRYFAQKRFDKSAHMEKIPGPTARALSRCAQENKIVLVGGSIFEKARKANYNTACVFGPDGSMLGNYRKMHIPHDEEFFEQDYFAPGDGGFKVFRTPFAKIGTLICFDQWFPEAARISALMGAQILFYPTAIATSSHIEQAEGPWQDAWETVMRGHAIANNVAVCAVNRVGTEGDMSFWGGSFVSNAWGKVVAKADGSEQVLVAELDLSLNKDV